MNPEPIHNLPGLVIRALKLVRQAAYMALGPFDYLSRTINDKVDFPPLHLRRYVGPLRSFESSGAEFMSYLRLIARLRPDESILDVGCGCGLMALYLKDFLGTKSSYVGVDLHKPSVRWCLNNIASRHPNFAFAHIDVKNSVFNPRGQYAAEVFSLPYGNGAFDIILLKSVFTHMRPSEVDNYLKEVSRLLSAGGRCLATFFLLNEKQEELNEKGLNKVRFDSGDETWRYVYKNSPESAVAYREGFITELLDKYGLALAAPVMYGSWSGLEDGLSFQDMLLLQKR